MSELTHQPKGDTIAPSLSPSESPLATNPAAVYLSRLTSAASRRTQRGALESIARLISQQQQGVIEFAWSRLRYQHTAAIRTALVEQYAPATANRLLSAMRGVLKESWRLGQMSAEEYQRAADVANIKSEQLPAGRAIARSEIAALLEACRGDRLADVRDAALFAVMRSGLRRSEVVKLDVADIDLEDGEVRIREGKGRKDRICYLSPAGLPYVAAWVKRRGSHAGVLFLPIDQKGRLGSTRLTDSSVRYILQKRAEQAGLGEMSPHDWRRTFVSDLLDAGVDIATVQKLAGHSSVQTTARYDRRGEKAKRKAMEGLGF